jgi:hypothetical protein
MNKKGYSFNDMPQLALIFTLVAVFFVVAILILTAIGDNTNFAPETTVTNEEFTFPARYGNVTLANTYVQTVTSVINSTSGVYPAANYTLWNTNNDGYGKLWFVENATVCKTGDTCRVTYTYNDHDSKQGTVVTNAITAMSEIPSNWLLLIAVVLAASVLIGIVVNNLGINKGGR